jgi:Fe2+ or Zn2+ uptake regulation protein
MSTLVKNAWERLQSQGGRMTSQRRLILETLDTLDCHPTAEELFDAVNEQDANLNLSTVYRTLRWLEQEGLVSSRRFDEERRKDRFDPVLPTEHHHFLCTHCKDVIEFDSDLIEQVVTQFENRSGARVETSSLVLYGLCSRCQGK